MKRRFLILVMLAYVLFSYAQDYPVDMYYTLSRNYAGWKAKSNVHIVKISHHTFISGVNPNSPTIEENFCLYEEGSNEPHEIKTKFDGAMVCDYKKVEDVWNHYIMGSVFNMIQKKGYQTPLRNEMEEDAIDFINKLQNDGRAFKDPYLENYIYSLVAKIAPVTLIDGRPGNVNIVILDDAILNAFTFSNGTIVVTTGLLAALHTEDELVAILAHEIAHFVLDHSIANVNADAKRQKRAEFWASVATGVAAVAEGVAAMKNPYYRPGNGTLAVAMISSSIAESYLKRQGMAYNHEQESEADKVAWELLRFLGYDQNALATALSRLWKTYTDERSNAVYYASYTHPALIERITNMGKPNEKCDPQYEKMVSFAVSSAAMKKYANRRYRQTLSLVNQNIKNNVGTVSDYILRASCMLALKNDQDSNQEALNSINKAKSLRPNDLNLYKPEIIALLRLNKRDEAINVLKQYQTSIKQEYENLKQIGNDAEWSLQNNYLNSEYRWAANMLIKLNGM